MDDGSEEERKDGIFEGLKYLCCCSSEHGMSSLCDVYQRSICTHFVPSPMLSRPFKNIGSLNLYSKPMR